MRQTALAVVAAVCVLLPLAGTASSVAAAGPVVPKVVGGHPGDGSEVAFMMALGYKTNFLVNGMEEAHFCGGALVAPERVLTAAHCVAKTPANNLVVANAPADGNLSSVTEAYTVRSVTIHPQYDAPTSAYDVAVVTLNAQVDAGVPIPVAYSPDTPYVQGGPARVMGWGAVDYEGTTYPDRLVVGDVALVSDANCGSDSTFTTPEGQFYGWGQLFLPTSMVCATGADAAGAVVDACNGDSGGPLVGPGPELLGVVSWGSVKCGFPAPGVYARLGALTEFLAAEGVPVPGLEPPPASQLSVAIVSSRALRAGHFAFKVSVSGATWAEADGYVKCSSRPFPSRRAPVDASGIARVRGLAPGKLYTCVAIAAYEGSIARSATTVLRARR